MSSPKSTARRSQDDRTQTLLQRAHDERNAARAEELRAQAVLENRSLAIAIARQYENKGVEHDDLVQVAMVGLVQAARRYRPGAGHGFAAFAVPTITGELKRHFRDHGWAVRPPRGLQEMHGRMRRAGAHLEQDLQREPTDGELAAYLDASEESVREARMVDSQYHAASLDAPVRAAAETSLGDSLPDGDDDDPYDQVVALVSLRSAMGQLSRRERMVLRLRFVENMTQRQIGHRIGVSQMQVSRLLRDIYEDLRAMIDDQESRPVTEIRHWRSAV